MSFLTSHKDYEAQQYLDLCMRKFVWFVSKNGALIGLYRVHVSLLRAHDFHGIVNCCKTESLIWSHILEKDIQLRFKISYRLH